MNLANTTAARLELPTRRERLLRQILEAGEAGMKVPRRARGPMSTAKLPPDATELLRLGYAKLVVITREVTDKTGTHDVPQSTFRDPGGSEDYNVLSITPKGTEALASLDAWLAEQSQRRTSLDVGRYRRQVGGETVCRFNGRGEFKLALYPGPLTTLGKDWMLAVELGLVRKLFVASDDGESITFSLTQAGVDLRRQALGLPPADRTVADVATGQAVAAIHNAITMAAPSIDSAIEHIPAREHDLYKTGDADAPLVIKDRNGDVVLGLCRRCGRGEIELCDPCDPLVPPRPMLRDAALARADAAATTDEAIEERMEAGRHAQFTDTLPSGRPRKR